jgi:hypothetical protein
MFIVKTGACLQQYRKKVAVIELEPGAADVARISERTRGCRRIVRLWDGCSVMRDTNQSEFGRAVAKAVALAAKLNAGE